MPWIAANYQWVLHHEICVQNPPVFNLLRNYRMYRIRNITTRCTSTLIQQLFEAYPQGLAQVDEHGYTPLHVILIGSAECNADLFKWMAERCPSNMLERDRSGRTPLYLACRSLIRHLGDDSSEICKYLIAKCPELVRIPGLREGPPIHLLLRHCQHPLVKEVVVCLLREYPESYGMVASGSCAPSSIPFVQRIKPLLDGERELKESELGESVAYLQQVSMVFQDAVDGTNNPSPLASSTYIVFDSWTKSFTQHLEARMERISTELQYECNVEEEGDHEHAIDE